MKPVHLCFLGCGFIARVHSLYLQKMRSDVVCSYASRDPSRAAEYQRRFAGVGHYGSYDDALRDPAVDAVVVALPTRYHLELTLQALAMGKHVLVEKPAFPNLDDYQTVIEARARSGRVVLVGENDHYKPLCVELRRLLASGVIGELVFGHFVTIMKKPKSADDWRNDEAMAGGDAFFEEGIHWLHIASSLGPRIRTIHGYRPPPASDGPLQGDARRKSMLVAFQYDNGAVGALYYSREIPSLLGGLRLSKLFGREGIITFESNGVFILVRGSRRRLPRLKLLPGFRDIRGYRAMYRDFVGATRNGTTPEMSLERARDDHRLMDAVYASADSMELACS
ncbi:MAG TPA: Gfo/Idh/MocA family oxidoreductase [Vicinamibacteria bacterium]|nr:Gfo/Idh/MocA family oxidoreductase [Vicinamibacteria bacterium]